MGGALAPRTASGEPRWGRRLALAFALVLPTLLTLADFVILANDGKQSANPAQQLAYFMGKVFQFSLPVLCFWWFEHRLPRPARPDWRGLRLGLAFGLIVVAGMLALYFGYLGNSPFMRQTPAQVREKMVQFGLASPVGFAAFAVGLSVFHSLLEEYYWRWFAFGWLRREMPGSLAIAVSSLAFMSHHVILLAVYFPGHWLTVALPLSLCVAAGGAIWAWLYQKTNSIFAPWLSHLLVDAGLFVVGYDLLFVKAA